MGARRTSAPLQVHLLRRTSPVMALNGRSEMSALWSLSGVKRT